MPPFMLPSRCRRAAVALPSRCRCAATALPSLPAYTAASPLTPRRCCPGAQEVPQPVNTSSGRHRFGSIFTGEWYAKAVEALPPGTSLRPFSLFWDPTVRQSTGAKYCVLQLYDHGLPLAGAGEAGRSRIPRTRSRAPRATTRHHAPPDHRALQVGEHPHNWLRPDHPCAHL